MPAGSPAVTRWCVMPAWTSPSTPLTPSAALATWPARAPRCCAGRCLRRTAPDHASLRPGQRPPFCQPRATLSTARKLARQARHVLVELGEQALAPVDGELLPPLLAVPLPEAA
jgi:hypothetical protein